MYLLVYVGLLIAGSGRYSVDGLLQRKLNLEPEQQRAASRQYTPAEVG